MCPSGSIYKKTNRSTLYTVNSVNTNNKSLLQAPNKIFFEGIQTKFLAFLLSQLQIFQIFVKNWLKMKKQGKTFPLQPDLPLLYVFQKFASYTFLKFFPFHAHWSLFTGNID